MIIQIFAGGLRMRIVGSEINDLVRYDRSGSSKVVDFAANLKRV